MEPISFLALPTELRIQTIGYLSFPENVNLMITCSHSRSLIALDHVAQIDAETSSYTRDKKLYACPSCAGTVGACRLHTGLQMTCWGVRGGEVGREPRGGSASSAAWGPDVQTPRRGTHLAPRYGPKRSNAVCVMRRQFTLGMTDVNGRAQQLCEPCGLLCGVEPQGEYVPEAR